MLGPENQIAVKRNALGFAAPAIYVVMPGELRTERLDECALDA